MADGPEKRRLLDRLCNDPKRTLLNFKVTRGPDGCDEEVLCRAINESMDRVDRGEVTAQPFPRCTREPMDVREWLKTLEITDG